MATASRRRPRTTGSAFATASVPKPGDSHRLYTEVLSAFWQPQPSHTLFDTKTFKAGLAIQGREVTSGDMVFQRPPRRGRKGIRGARVGAAHAQPAGAQARLLGRRAERRDRPRDRRALPLQGDARAQGARDEGRRHTGAHRRGDAFASAATATSCDACCGPHASRARVYFRGNDRSPGDKRCRCRQDRRGDPRPGAARGLRPLQGGRGQGADVRRAPTPCSPPRTSRGYPRVRQSRPLARREGQDGLPRRKRSPQGGLRPHRGTSELRRYGERPLPRDEFAKEPFGWDFEAVRLLVLSLLRAGRSRRPARARRSTSSTGVEARDTFSNNNLFRQASFRPKKGIEFEELVKASEAFRDTFGSEVQELNTAAIVSELRKEIARNEDTVRPRSRRSPQSPSRRHCARRRPRPDEGNPARLGGQRDRYVQRSHRPSRTPSSAPRSSSRR